MNDGVEALVSFVGAHGDAFELFEFAEEVFDQMTPFVHFFVDCKGKGAPRMLGDDDLGAAFVEVSDDNVAVEGLVGEHARKERPSISGATPTVSNRWPGNRTKRTRLPSASVRARILVVMPPLERPMAWL